MKKSILIAVLMVIYSNIGFANHEEKTKINIILKEQSNVTELMRTASVFPNKAAQREFVVGTLKQQAEESQSELMALLKELESNGLVEEIRPLWIVNSISCYVEESVIQEIETRNDVLTVYPCEPFPLIYDEPTIPVVRGDGREIAQNLLQVNADQVWAQGYTGEGVLIAIIDTGVRLDHADLQGQLWDGGPEYPNHGYDFYSHDTGLCA